MNYFQDSYWLTRTPGFSHIFSSDDYLLLRSVLHVVDDEKNTENDKLFKIRPILDEVSVQAQLVLNKVKSLKVLYLNLTST